MNFNIKHEGGQSKSDMSLKKLLKSTALMASGFSILILPENPNELCDELKILLQEKQAGYISNIIDEEIVATANKLLEHKSISKKQHKTLLLKFSV